MRSAGPAHDDRNAVARPTCWQPPHNAEPVTILADTPRWLRVGGVTGRLALGVTGAGAVIIWAVSYTSITLVSGIFAGLGALSSILFICSSARSSGSGAGNCGRFRPADVRV